MNKQKSGPIEAFIEDASETFGHSRLLILRAVDELVKEPMALMYIQLQNVVER